jgi:hypothetical protein
MSADDCAALADLIGAWFHQDYEGAIPKIVAAFRAVTTPTEWALARTDTARLVAEHPDDLQKASEGASRPGAIPAGVTLELLHCLLRACSPDGGAAFMAK